MSDGEGGARQTALRLIGQAALGATPSLSLAGLGLTVLPEALGTLSELTRLDLSGNKLAELPEWIGDLRALEELVVRDNLLVRLPDALLNLRSLAVLDAGDNRLVEIPSGLAWLPRLTTLDLRGNRHLILPPPQVVARGGEAALEYLRGFPDTGGGPAGPRDGSGRGDASDSGTTHGHRSARKSAAAVGGRGTTPAPDPGKRAGSGRKRPSLLGSQRSDTAASTGAESWSAAAAGSDGADADPMLAAPLPDHAFQEPAPEQPSAAHLLAAPPSPAAVAGATPELLPFDASLATQTQPVQAPRPRQRGGRGSTSPRSADTAPATETPDAAADSQSTQDGISAWPSEAVADGAGPDAAAAGTDLHDGAHGRVSTSGNANPGNAALDDTAQADAVAADTALDDALSGSASGESGPADAVAPSAISELPAEPCDPAEDLIDSSAAASPTRASGRPAASRTTSRRGDDSGERHRSRGAAVAGGAAFVLVVAGMLAITLHGNSSPGAAGASPTGTAPGVLNGLSAPSGAVDPTGAGAGPDSAAGSPSGGAHPATAGSATAAGSHAGSAAGATRAGGGSTSPTRADPPSYPTAAPGVDLARGRPISGSSTMQDYVAANADDGDVNSYWESLDSQGMPQSLTADLGEVTTVGRFVFNLPQQSDWNERTETFSILGSTNGTSFFTIRGTATYTFNANSSSDDAASVTVSVAHARYIELYFTATDGWPAAQMGELNVYS